MTQSRDQKAFQSVHVEEDKVVQFYITNLQNMRIPCREHAIALSLPLSHLHLLW